MPKRQFPPNPERERAVQVTAWFSVLAHAKSTNDFRKAAEALDALERLGVRVKYGRRPKGERP